MDNAKRLQEMFEAMGLGSEGDRAKFSTLAFQDYQYVGNDEQQQEVIFVKMTDYSDDQGEKRG